MRRREHRSSQNRIRVSWFRAHGDPIQNAFDWLDPNISVGMGRRRISVVPTFRTAGTPFRMTKQTRPSR
jgi:hypothetical protein